MGSARVSGRILEAPVVGSIGGPKRIPWEPCETNRIRWGIPRIPWGSQPLPLCSLLVLSVPLPFPPSSSVVCQPDCMQTSSRGFRLVEALTTGFLSIFEWLCSGRMRPPERGTRPTNYTHIGENTCVFKSLFGSVLHLFKMCCV